MYLKSRKLADTPKDFPNSLQLVLAMEIISYGERLLPHVVDEAAQHDPTRIVGLIAKSVDLSQGFLEVTIGDIAQAANYMAWWIEARIGGGQEFRTIAYLVGRSKLENVKVC